MTYETLHIAAEDILPRYYLSGPMTGLPEYNYPRFNTVAAQLRAAGYNVVNPAELHSKDHNRHSCLRRDLRALCDCTDLILLEGWQESDGAHLELHLAHRLGLGIHFLHDLLWETP